MSAPKNGFTAAVHPITDQTVVVTPSHGLVAGAVEISAADRAIPGCRAAPLNGTNLPVAWYGRLVRQAGPNTPRFKDRGV